jgi:hypothetical protein
MSWRDTTPAPNVKAAAMLPPRDSPLCAKMATRDGSEEQMFGTKQQVAHGGEPTKERTRQRTGYPTIRLDVA